MLYSQAKQLHNQDQVIVKKTGETLEVLTTEVRDKDVIVFGMSSEYGYHGFHHREVL